MEEIGQELGRWIAGETNPKLDGAFAEWKQQTGLAFSVGRGIINLPDIPIKPSVSARHVNSFTFDAPDGSGEISSIPGEYIHDVKVFAGKGTNVPFRMLGSSKKFIRYPLKNGRRSKDTLG